MNLNAIHSKIDEADRQFLLVDYLPDRERADARPVAVRECGCLMPCDALTTMEMNEQPFAPTLAHRLGDVPHVSGLLRRIAQVSGAGERVADWLLKVAVECGASHYRRDFDLTLPVDSELP